MDDARIRTVRFLLNWKWVQPVQGPPRWGATDKLIGRLAINGIRVLPSVWGNPEWVFGGEARPPMDSTFSRTAWQNFLKALVSRYGPNGSYWTTTYRQTYGANATPWPIQAWQIWNEPNLKKFYVPYPSPQNYAKLVKLSHSAIRSRDPKAQVVLAGMPGSGDMKAWDFLSTFYNQGTKSYFDAVALHPYASDIAQVRSHIQKIRDVMVNRADRATPLWLTEFAWGSDPPDRFGINKGALQDEYLRSAYKMILQNRTAWNVQRLYWYLWRDPRPAGGNACSFCGSAGVLRYNRTKKPSYPVFRSFTAETVPPQASITGGPAQGGFTRDRTPTFSFASNEPGSTFVCKVDGRPFKPCSRPYTTPALSNGNHLFYVRAIDAPGNESQIVYRYFTVDTVAPPAPTITDTDPNSPANDNAPEVKGTAQAGTTVKLFKTAGCTAGTAVAQGSAARFASPGITVTVADDTTTAFRARAMDAAGNLSACSGAFNYVEDSTP
jgi:Glycosyl hydrolase catalytic core